MSEVYDPREQGEIIDTFAAMLDAATKDGGKKRAAGTKPSWKVDPDHEAAVWSHINKWKHSELVDPESGAHPLVHAAWRLLAIAWQEDQVKESEPRRAFKDREDLILAREAEKHLAKNCTICQVDGIRAINGSPMYYND